MTNPNGQTRIAFFDALGRLSLNDHRDSRERPDRHTLFRRRFRQRLCRGLMIVAVLLALGEIGEVVAGYVLGHKGVVAQPLQHQL